MRHKWTNNSCWSIEQSRGIFSLCTTMCRCLRLAIRINSPESHLLGNFWVQESNQIVFSLITASIKLESVSRWWQIFYPIEPVSQGKRLPSSQSIMWHTKVSLKSSRIRKIHQSSRDYLEVTSSSRVVSHHVTEDTFYEAFDSMIQTYHNHASVENSSFEKLNDPPWKWSLEKVRDTISTFSHCALCVKIQL